MTRLTWVNHAGYLLEHDDVGILVDPWFAGTAFDDGWAPTSEPVAPDFSRVNYVWLSHEHPDHFSPRSLSSVPAAARAAITVLFQRSRDQRVAKACRQLGFTVRETDREDVQLGPSITARIASWTGGDSMLAVRAGDLTILNLNDAVIPDRGAARAAASRLGIERADVLLTQFSYANRVGNPDQPEVRRQEAERKLAALQLHARSFAARWVVPFASHVWFCHGENSYMNDEMVLPSRAVTAAAEVGTPVMLYPGDTWSVGKAHDAHEAALRYEADIKERLAGPPLVPSSPTVALDELNQVARTFADRLKDRNGRLVIRGLVSAGVLRPAILEVTDLDQRLALTTEGLGEAHDGPADVRLSSEALVFALRHEFGGATLQVNARFTVPAGGNFGRFRRYLMLSNINTRGLTVLRPGSAVTDKIRQLVWARQSTRTRSRSR
jgi:hypothetical protein